MYSDEGTRLGPVAYAWDMLGLEYVRWLIRLN